MNVINAMIAYLGVDNNTNAFLGVAMLISWAVGLRAFLSALLIWPSRFRSIGRKKWRWVLITAFGRTPCLGIIPALIYVRKVRRFLPEVRRARLVPASLGRGHLEPASLGRGHLEPASLGRQRAKTHQNEGTRYTCRSRFCWAGRTGDRPCACCGGRYECLRCKT